MKPIQNALLPLSYYVDESIAFLREHEPQEGFFVGFSGGKDSIVTLALCRMAGVKHTPYYTYTTIDPPEVAKFIRTEYPDVNWLRPKKSFFAYVQRNAPPLRMQRWCCHHIKEMPSWDVPLHQCVFGIRAEESAKRAARGIVEIIGRNGCFLWQWLGHPIVNGKAYTNHLRIIDSRKPVAVVTGDGEQYILGG